MADLIIERIRVNFAIQMLSDEDQKTLDDLEIPNDKGRSIDFREGKSQL